MLTCKCMTSISNNGLFVLLHFLCLEFLFNVLQNPRDYKADFDLWNHYTAELWCCTHSIILVIKVLNFVEPSKISLFQRVLLTIELYTAFSIVSTMFWLIHSTAFFRRKMCICGGGFFFPNNRNSIALSSSVNWTT